MFEKYHGTIELDNVLKEECNYIYNGNFSLFCDNKFVEVEGNGIDALYWVTINNERFLLKNVKNFKTDIWGELLSEEVAKHFHLPCAQYKVARLGSWQGLITKDFISKDETLILGSEIFQRFLNSTIEQEDLLPNPISNKEQKQDAHEKKKYIFTYLNNYEESSKIISTSNYLTKQEKENITLHLLKMLIFDIITLQWDRHPNNWGIMKTENGYLPSPLFDNNTSFGLGLPNIDEVMLHFRQEHMNYRILKDDRKIKGLIYRGNPRFAYSKEDVIDILKKEKLPGDKVLHNLLSKVDSNIIDKISSLLLSVDFDFIEDVIMTVEEKNGVQMDDLTYYYISNMFKENVKYLKEIVNNYQRSNSSKHEKSR